MNVKASLASLAFSVITAACAFDAALPARAVIRCGDGADCPDALVCLAGSCVDNSACLVVTGRNAVAQKNGNVCGGGHICVDGACTTTRCGDGVVTGAETCDGTDGCRSDCTSCGDGVVDVDDGEACDLGDANSDSVPGACRTTCTPAACGDGVIDPGEACDDGVANSDESADACRTSCVRASCGDGVVDTGEACDDGNVISGDGCRGDCGKVEACGDGVIDPGEACDDANDNPSGGPALAATFAGPGGIAVDCATVIGDGSHSSAGEGAPARELPIDTPGQLAVDSRGNLFITSRTTVRLVANVDGDVDADGDDRVFTVYGGGDRSSFPESSSSCLSALALKDDAHVEIADACQGFLVELARVP